MGRLCYDIIGNRQWSNITGNTTLRDNYTTNALNQIVTRENNTVSVSGTADATAKVVLGGRTAAAARKGNFWSDDLTVANVLSPWRGPLTIYTGKAGAGTSGADLIRTDVRMAQVAQQLQSFSYDADGNLTGDGVWAYSWDAENRLTQMSTTTAAVNAGFPNRVLQFQYDYLGRRVKKLVIDGGSNQLLSGRRFLYDGWNLIAEYADTGATAIGALVRSYTWGLDIAKTLNDAGGVGALLQIADQASGKVFFPTYDGNGNVLVVLNASNGALAATYEYSPYGEPLHSQTFDAVVGDQPFRFSTKFLDIETGLVYYGRRYYDPRTGRWLCRDPKEELGGYHLYGFNRNNPINFYDFLGQTPQASVSAGNAIDPSTGKVVSNTAKSWDTSDDDGYGGASLLR
jgi:RHS repeat-associated protein